MKFIFSLLVAVIIGSLSCSAADLDAVDHYSFDPVTMSAFDYAVMPLAATSWDTADRAFLTDIRNGFYNAGSSYTSNSLLGWVKKLADNSVSLSGLISDVSSIDDNFRLNVSANEGSLVDTVRDLESLLTTSNSYTATGNGYLYQLVKAIDSDTYNIRDMTQGIWSDTGSIDSTLSSFFSSFTSLSDFLTAVTNVRFHSIAADGTVSSGPFYYGANMRYWIAYLSSTLTYDGYSYNHELPTLYHLIKRLADVQANYDDLALAESQKANREEIEDSFLNGSSGSTSLGVSDFGDLADVGGTIKDSLSLDGNATIGSFTSGLAAADSAGQGWFSEETRSQLDAVSSTVTYSFSDSDPYNMAGWEDRYYWLLGDDK